MPETVLSFGAHPDDMEIGCGGTEALLLQKGFDIVHVYATSGECGSRKSTKEKLAAERERRKPPGHYAFFRAANLVAIKSIASAILANSRDELPERT